MHDIELVGRIHKALRRWATTGAGRAAVPCLRAAAVMSTIPDNHVRWVGVQSFLEAAGSWADVIQTGKF